MRLIYARIISECICSSCACLLTILLFLLDKNGSRYFNIPGCTFDAQITTCTQ